jgi:superfamily II DNA or RNA helicase
MIRILDQIFCRAEKGDVQKIKPLLSYSKTFSMKKRYKREVKKYTGSLISGNGVFPAGVLKRISKAFPSIKVEGDNLDRLLPENKAHLQGIKPRDDQANLIRAAILHQRGVLLSPTGSGKTIVAMLIVSCFPNQKALFLCHTISLLSQTEKEFKKFGFNTQIIGGGKKNFDPKISVTIATVQSFVKLNLAEISDTFGIVIVDEAHHCNSDKSQYVKILSNLSAPMRLGLTATLPNTREGLLFLEGYIGPVIEEVTVQEGVEKKMLAKPEIKLIPIPFNSAIGEHFKYADIHKLGIVENRSRNRIILEEARKQIGKNKTVLIMIKEIAHGNNLVEMAKDLFGIEIVFVQGRTENENRELIQRTLNKKIIKCVVCTAVWREGINIKSLDTIILALGGKSAIQTAQALGRGLRIDKGKDSVLLIDFLDPYKYLAQHVVARISLYIKNNWM